MGCWWKDIPLRKGHFGPKTPAEKCTRKGAETENEHCCGLPLSQFVDAESE
jgi:hypothetical protein